MSESQKKMAKRLVEILIEMGFIKERKSKCGVFWALDTRYADLVQKFTEALTKLETEELEGEFKKFREINRKAKE